MAADAIPAPDPVTLEYGRYRVFETPDGGWVIARAQGTCETCEHHDCGEQAEPVQVPGMFVKMARAQADGGGLMARAKGLIGLG